MINRIYIYVGLSLRNYLGISSIQNSLEVLLVDAFLIVVSNVITLNDFNE